MPKTRKMFLGSNSSLGFYSLFEQVFSEDLHRYFIIKGGPGTGKSVFMKRIGSEIETLGLDIEYYHCSSDSSSLDGVFIPSLKVALVDGTAPHVIEPKYPGLIDDILDFAQFLDRHQLQPHKNDIIKITQNASMYFKKAYMKLKQASIILDEIELNYVKPESSKITGTLNAEIFKDIHIKSNKPPKIRKFFASAITPTGISKHYNTLIDNNMRVYSLKGTMGLDTKDILAKIAANAYELGLDTEIYYCPFRPSNIDLVIIPLLNTAVIGSSPLYDSAGISKCNSGKIIDVAISSHIISTTLKNEFNHLIDKAIENIGQAKSSHDELEGIYSKAMSFDGVDQLHNDILNTLIELK